MTVTPAAKKNKDCPRCGKKFNCVPDNIDACDCTKVKLSTEEFRYIGAKFSTCVCNSCLTDLRNEYGEEFRKSHSGVKNA